MDDHKPCGLGLPIRPGKPAGGEQSPPVGLSATVAELLNRPLRISQTVADIAKAAGAEMSKPVQPRRIIGFLVNGNGELHSINLADGSTVKTIEIGDLPEAVRCLPDRPLTGAEVLGIFRASGALPRDRLALGHYVADKVVRAEGAVPTLFFRRAGR